MAINLARYEIGAPTSQVKMDNNSMLHFALVSRIRDSPKIHDLI
jgi:hypothetical protein